MLFIHCEKRDETWFSVTFDETLQIWSTAFSKERANALYFTLKHLPPNASVTYGVKGEYLRFAQRVIKILEALRDGKPIRWNFSLNLHTLPEFTQHTLKIVAEIPHGYVTTYGLIANSLTKRKAARAVARAIASNPLPLLIPCHRVIKSNLGIGGYSLGGDSKRKLLERELFRCGRRLYLRKNLGRLKLIPLREVLGK